jgi:hypothetical protein
MDVQLEIEVTIRTKGAPNEATGTGTATAAGNLDAVRAAAMDATIEAMREVVADVRSQPLPA